MSTVIYCGKAGNPAATLLRTSPAKPGYVLATHAHARVRGRHMHVTGILHCFEGN